MEHSSRVRRLTLAGLAYALILFPLLEVVHSNAPQRVLAASNDASTLLSDGPVSYWRRGEQSGTAAADGGTGGNAGRGPV